MVTFIISRIKNTKISYTIQITFLEKLIKSIYSQTLKEVVGFGY